MPIEILALGSNGNHQLGLGHDEDVSIAESLNPDFINSTGHAISQIVSGGNHTLFITADGDVFGCGSNDHGQLGSNINDKVIKEPKKLDLAGEKIRTAAAGWEYSIFVTDNDQLISCGNGPKGELGIGPKIPISATNDEPTFHKIRDFPPEGTRVVKINAGLAHVVVLLDDNSLWGWGSSRKGQLGDQNSARKICFEPVFIMKKDKNDSISHLSCGREFTVFGCEKSGTIEVLGGEKWGFKGQLSSPMSADLSALKFIAVDSGWSTIHRLSSDGKEITSWGNNSHFQQAPTSIRSLGLKFNDLVDGSEHSVVITDDRRNVYAWGWGEHGNCGAAGFNDDNQTYKLYSTTDATNRIKNVFCGHATTWIIIERNT
ncbi:Ats1p [Sugiyamaella lignohabitans]|uniref:Ats1p n=1 Tax=Sugiyamaella lignohabitans TaxID=796027 RepID=A0A167CGB9_9ASCO|nr:Ats1p [Sugiyamaella lignohabitans]ANB11652.1 Ats1p [Sugiyamaella lignohabitans]